MTATSKQKTNRRSFWEGAGLAALVAAVLVVGCLLAAQQPGTETSRSASASVGAAEVAPADWGSASFDYAAVPGFSGTPSVALNDGVPFFSEPDFSRGDAVELAELDESVGEPGRAGAAFATVGPSTLAEGERGSLSYKVRPSGWNQVNYHDLLASNYLYCRCHLAAWSLVGGVVGLDDMRNLITGTYYLNVSGMEPYEKQVLSYVRSTGNHVLYRVTPVFEGDELVARGVLVEAASVEDRDRAGSLRVCAWCYNVQPGIAIDYATGASEPDGEVLQEGEGWSGYEYVLNTSSKVFHLPTCRHVEGMRDSNREGSNASREELIERGYHPCGNCNP